MPTIERIDGYAEELTAIRRDLHAHPEIGFEEVRTSGIVADKLKGWGIEVHRGLGGTGVVGVLKGKGTGGKRIGLRADMDALPMEENTNLKWRSTIPGRFHGCGHDGHTTMLLGTARYLAETRNFDGTVHFIFQPGRRRPRRRPRHDQGRPVREFPCDEVYGLHNAPDLNHGEIAILPGPAMAGADFFDITIQGYGAHGAMPERSKDRGRHRDDARPGAADHRQPQRRSAEAGGAVDHPDPCRLRLQRHSGRSKALRHRARLSTTACGADPRADARDLRRHRRDVPVRDHRRHPRHVSACWSTRKSSQGGRGSGDAPWSIRQRSSRDRTPKMGSEDFADMMQAVPGAYFWIGHDGSVPVHNPGYVLDDKILPIGASMFARIIETRLPAGSHA